MSDWKPIGEIVLTQIQVDRLTDGEIYRTDDLRSVERLLITSDGVHGYDEGQWVLDRHHRQHPAARHWNAARSLSIGFTSHYRHMWDTFRTTELGSAGENLIVAADEMVTSDQIGGGVRIESNGVTLELGPAMIAQPCVPFTRFMTQRPDADDAWTQEQRDKLRQGVRGYVMGTDAADGVEVRPGAKVFISS